MPQKCQHPKLPAVSDQMQAWSSALAAEFASWPQVIAKSFLGFTPLHRGKRILAVLPRTRSWGNGNSLAFKLRLLLLPSVRSLIAIPALAPGHRKTRWFTIELSADRDLHGAIDWLSCAHDHLAKPRKSK